MPSIDERVVSMAFENAKFEAGVAKTIGSLTKLNATLKTVGVGTGLRDIEKAANQITLEKPMSLLDKLKAKLAGTSKDATDGMGGIEKAGDKVTLQAPMSALDKLKLKLFGTGKDAEDGLGNVEKAGNKVTLSGPMRVLDALKTRLFRSGDDAAQGMGEIERAGNKVTLEQPIKAINKVQSSVATVGANAPEGFGAIERAANGVNFGGLTSAIANVSTQFSVLQGAAAVALGNIASQATMRGLSFVKSFGMGPIIDGLHEYETNLKSIQTIQANTDRPLTEINKSLQELNRYSDQTIYNFSEMARNIGTFTAAGVDLKTATSSIKGIANLAALSGSSSQQAATAMYQLSQAISSGRVSLQDWNSVVNAGMGGKKLQTALATTAVAMGDIKSESVKLEGPMKKLTINGKSFRESIMAKPGETPWLSSEILVNTLATLDGRFSRAALSAERTEGGLLKYSKAQIEARIQTARTALEQKNGVKYTDEQFKALQKLSDSAFKSATEVKTLGQVFDVARETIGSGWSASFQNVFGTLKEAKKTFTGMSNAINGFINANSLARNTVLSDWKKLGGRTDLIAGITNIFKALIAIVKPVGEAFREIFPRKTGKDLAEMSENFRNFTKTLKIGPETAENIKRSFKGVFAVFSIGKSIVSEIFGVFKQLFGALGEGSGGFLGFTAGIGDFLVKADKAIKEGEGLHNFFEGLGKVLAAPVKLISAVANALGGLFDGFEPGAAQTVADRLDGFHRQLSPMEKLLNGIKDAWRSFTNVFKSTTNFLSPIIDQFKEFGDVASDAIANADYDNLFNAIQTILIGGIFLTIKKSLGGGNILEAIKGPFDSLSGTFDTLTGSLKTMQKGVQADILLKIAKAVALLAAAVFALSFIDPKNLASSLTGIAAGLGTLVGAIAILGGVGGKAGGKAGYLLGLAKMPILTSSLILLAVAVDALAVAVVIFSKLKWEEIGRGLAGVVGSLVALAPLALLGPGLAIAAVPLLVIAVALSAMAGALKLFSMLDVGEIGKGVAAIAASSIALTPLAFLGPGLLVAAVPLLVISVALNAMALALKQLGGMEVGEIAKGVAGLAGALIALTPIALLAPGLLVAAAPLLVISVALNLIAVAMIGLAKAIGMLGGMDMSTLAKGISAIGGALIVLAGGLTLMMLSLPGAVALGVAAAALTLLVPVIGILGTMKWSTILKGLGALAGIMIVISGVALVATPGLIALGLALSVLGLGVLALGAGVNLLTSGLAKLGGDGSKSIAAVMVALTALVALLPKIVIDFLKGMVAIAGSLAELAPKVISAFIKIITMLIQAGLPLAPLVAKVAIAIIAAFVKVLNESTPGLIEAGWKLLLSMLKGIEDHIADVVTTVGMIMFKFLAAVLTFVPKLLIAGAKILFEFLKGIANNIGKVVDSAGTIITNFLNGITRALPRVTPAAARTVVTFLNGIASKVGDVIEAGVDLVVKVIRGITNGLPRLVSAGVALISRFILEIGKNAPKLADSGAKAVIKFVEGTADAIRNNSAAMGRAGADLGVALVEGMIRGMGSMAGALVKKALSIFGGVPGPVKKLLGINSPSKVFEDMGNGIVEGFVLGIKDVAPAKAAVSTMANGVISMFKDIFQIHSPSQVMREIGKFVGEGFKEGLLESEESINTAFTDLKGKLSEHIVSIKDQIVTEQAKLDSLLSASKPNTKKIAEVQEAIAKNNELLNASRQAHKELVKELAAEKGELLKKAAEFKQVSIDLEAAQQKLDSLKKEREDFVSSTTGQYSTLPEIIKDPEKQAQSLALYQKSLADQVTATKTYTDTLDQLRALGLDDETYEKLLKEGPADQAFANQLLAGGKTAVDGLNELDRQLKAASESLATKAAINLKDAGILAADGIVQGLTTKKGEIYKAMEDIATSMIRAIRKKLKIKSPSQEFSTVGKFATRGLIDGLKSSTRQVISAASDVGDTALSALKDTMSSISDIMTADINMDPTITPVLDLSNVEKEARRLGDMTNVVPITAAASFNSAAAISAAQTEAQSSQDAAVAAATVSEIKFEQNNYSPESLSPTEVYRQTKNQLAQAKSVLGIAG